MCPEATPTRMRTRSPAWSQAGECPLEKLLPANRQQPVPKDMTRAAPGKARSSCGSQQSVPACCSRCCSSLATSSASSTNLLRSPGDGYGLTEMSSLRAGARRRPCTAGDANSTSLAEINQAEFSHGSPLVEKLSGSSVHLPAAEVVHLQPFHNLPVST